MSQQNSQQGASTDLCRPLQPAGEIEIPSSEFLQPMHVAEKMRAIPEQLKVTKEENGKLGERLKTFKKENPSMNEKMGELEKNYRQQRETIRSLEEALEKLQKELETVNKANDKKNEILMEKVEKLTKNLSTVEKENKDLNAFLQKENEKLQNEMGELKEKHNKTQEKLDRKETRLALGQVAWRLETEIWKNVLPDIKPGYTRILSSMERWLKKNEKNEEGKNAQKRWKELKSRLNWDEGDHKSALKTLKDLRVGDAHPAVVDLDEARKQLKEGDYIAEPDKEFCQQIIGMIKTLDQRIQ